MRTFIIVVTLFFCLTTFGQKESSSFGGHLIKISGLTYEKCNKDTVRLATIELLTNSKLLIATRTDLDGKFHWTVCSNKLWNKSLTIRVTAAGYYQKTVDFTLDSDTLIALNLIPDPKKKITLKAQSEYEHNVINECGTADLEKEYKENAFYRHCDGRLMRFQELMAGKENLNEWDKITSEK